MDAFVKNPRMVGDVAKFAMDNPQIAKAAMSLLSSREGPSGGLTGILGALQSNGLGDTVSSWLGKGDNKAISPEQVKSALGSDTIAKFAKQAGINADTAGAAIAGLLPGMVDKLSPDGKLPDSANLDSMLGNLMGSLSGKA
jgi:uncharacterized protein YidB (DUF937 family)